MLLDTKKASEVNVLVGLLPANEQLQDNKMLITGEANINLKNALGGGETIRLNWQQIQVKSHDWILYSSNPIYSVPPFGLNFNFDLLKELFLYKYQHTCRCRLCCKCKTIRFCIYSKAHNQSADSRYICC